MFLDTVVTWWSRRAFGQNPAFFTGGVTYQNTGALTISMPGTYFVYAMMPRDGQRRTGFSIVLNRSIIVARTFYTRPNTTGTNDDKVMFAGAMRYLNEGDSSRTIRFMKFYNHTVSGYSTFHKELTHSTQACSFIN